MEVMRLMDKALHIAQKKRINQAELARLIGAPASRLSEWKNDDGRPSVDQALRIARVLGVPLDYLADDSQDEPPKLPRELTEDERLALNFYSDIKANEGSATAVLKVLAKMANEGVKAAQPVPATKQQFAAETIDLTAPKRRKGTA